LENERRERKKKKKQGPRACPSRNQSHLEVERGIIIIMKPRSCEGEGRYQSGSKEELSFHPQYPEMISLPIMSSSSS
jgi:hypothetical protein